MKLLFKKFLFKDLFVKDQFAAIKSTLPYVPTKSSHLYLEIVGTPHKFSEVEILDEGNWPKGVLVKNIDIKYVLHGDKKPKFCKLYTILVDIDPIESGLYTGDIVEFIDTSFPNIESFLLYRELLEK